MAALPSLVDAERHPALSVLYVSNPQTCWSISHPFPVSTLGIRTPGCGSCYKPSLSSKFRTDSHFCHGGSDPLQSLSWCYDPVSLPRRLLTAVNLHCPAIHSSLQIPPHSIPGTNLKGNCILKYKWRGVQTWASMQDDSLPSVFSPKSYLQGHFTRGQFFSWRQGPALASLRPATFSSSCSRFLGKFCFLGIHGSNSLIAIEMSTFVPARRARKTPCSLS